MHIHARCGAAPPLVTFGPGIADTAPRRISRSHHGTPRRTALQVESRPPPCLAPRRV